MNDKELEELRKGVRPLIQTKEAWEDFEEFINEQKKWYNNLPNWVKKEYSRRKDKEE